MLKDVGKIIHHFIPLSRESLLKQQTYRIVFSVIFLFFCRWGFLGCARAIVLKRYKIETQLAILRPSRGYALKKMTKNNLLWYHRSELFLARNVIGDIIKKCIEISQIFNNITKMYQRCNHKNRYTVIHDFYLWKKCTETIKIQSERLARMVASYLWEEMWRLLAFVRRWLQWGFEGLFTIKRNAKNSRHQKT